MNEHRITEADVENFATILTTRMLIVANGLKVKLKDLPEDRLRDLSEACFPEEHGAIPNPFMIPWNLYSIEVNNPCPIGRLTMPHWLVAGLVAATGDFQYSPANIDPADWFAGMDKRMAETHPDLLSRDVRCLMDLLVKADRDSTEDLTTIREAVKAKVEALEARKGGDDELGGLLKTLEAMGATIIRL